MLAEQEQQRQQPIEAVGVDPGEVHHAIAHVAFYGYRYERRDSGDTVKTPIFEIRHWEHWDFKRKITYRTDDEWRLKTNKYENLGENHGDLLYQGQSLAQFVVSADWLFERAESGELLPIVKELQPGHVLNHELNCYVISHLLPCAIRTVDLQRGLGNARAVVHAARKYGLPNKGEKDYEQRKEKAEEICRRLCLETGHAEYNTYLDLIVAALHRDYAQGPKSQIKIHDMCEAFLLALQHCTQEWEKREKADDNAISVHEVPRQTTATTIFDSEEDDNLDEKAPKARKGRRKNDATTTKKRKPGKLELEWVDVRTGKKRRVESDDSL